MPFTKEEKELMDLIVKAHNKFMSLPITHTSERQEWVKAIHDLQNVIGFRILRRDYPKEFPTYK